MEKTKLYNKEGKENGFIELPAFFATPYNGDLIAQVMNVLSNQNRKLSAHAKGRGEVSGGGKKPWKQKGTGRARHGSTRSPLWVGGGVTFGPDKKRNYDLKINKKMKAKALKSVLSQKLKDKEIIFVDTLDTENLKTKVIATSVDALLTAENLRKTLRPSTLVALSKTEKNIIRAGRNIKNAYFDIASNLSLLPVLNHKVIILTKAGLEDLKTVLKD
ncbi:MAG TPA: 50S ribosomal protein L4 [Candidatus Paceibacterota bacterium]|nr:50S ribosomal protein L4 [Candidatus Paceibacterota bacterium]